MNFFDGTDLWTLSIIVGLTGVTILTRSFFFFSSEEWALPDWAQRGLQYAPIAAMAAVVLPAASRAVTLYTPLLVPCSKSLTAEAARCRDASINARMSPSSADGAAGDAMDALRLLSRTEGIIPAIESSHALAGALKLGTTLKPGSSILVNLSGRGDKDMETAGKYFGLLDSEAGK